MNAQDDRNGGLWNLQAGERLKIRRPGITLEDQGGEFSFALDLNQARVFELFHMVRDGGRADFLMLIEGAAGDAASGGDLLQNGEAARV